MPDIRSIPPGGPLTEDPWPAILAGAQRDKTLAVGDTRAMLGHATRDLVRGAWDEHVLALLCDQEPGVTATVASLIRRAWALGIEQGRHERVDELPAVQHLAATLDRLSMAFDVCDRRLTLAHDALTSIEAAAIQAGTFEDPADALVEFRGTTLTEVRKARLP